MSLKCTKNRKKCVVPQFHKSVTHTRKQVKAWNKDYHSTWNRDFGDYIVTKVVLAKTGVYGGPNKRVNGLRLYNIHIRKS